MFKLSLCPASQCLSYAWTEGTEGKGGSLSHQGLLIGRGSRGAPGAVAAAGLGALGRVAAAGQAGGVATCCLALSER